MRILVPSAILRSSYLLFLLSVGSLASSRVFAVAGVGALKGIGLSDNGQMGNGQSGTGSSRFTLPEQILAGVKEASSGYTHTLFVKSDDTLWGMGLSSYGCLGPGYLAPTQQATPIQ